MGRKKNCSKKLKIPREIYIKTLFKVFAREKP